MPCLYVSILDRVLMMFVVWRIDILHTARHRGEFCARIGECADSREVFLGASRLKPCNRTKSRDRCSFKLGTTPRFKLTGEVSSEWVIMCTDASCCAMRLRVQASTRFALAPPRVVYPMRSRTLSGVRDGPLTRVVGKE